MNHKLFTPARLGGLSLKNRIVMAPLTRSRAIGNLPNALMEQPSKAMSSYVTLGRRNSGGTSLPE